MSTMTPRGTGGKTGGISAVAGGCRAVGCASPLAAGSPTRAGGYASHPMAAPLVPLTAADLTQAWGAVLERNRVNREHIIEGELFSTRARMGQLLARLRAANTWLTFRRLLIAAEGRAGVVVTFVALLELIKRGVCRPSKRPPN